MKPKHFPFCAVKPLTDEVSTSEQKMNPKREHFSCREKEALKSMKQSKKGIFLSKTLIPSDAEVLCVKLID